MVKVPTETCRLMLNLRNHNRLSFCGFKHKRSSALKRSTGEGGEGYRLSQACTFQPQSCTQFSKRRHLTWITLEGGNKPQGGDAKISKQMGLTIIKQPPICKPLS